MQKTVKLYSDTIHILFNQNARNRYVIEETGKSPVGVTTVLQLLAKPGLMTWPMYEALTYIKTIDGVITKQHIELASKAYLTKSDTGKSTGTAIHAAIEAHLNGEEYKEPPEAEKAFQGWLRWFNEHNPVVVGVEQIVYSKANDFCGTFDCLLEIDDQTVLVDIKTNNTSRTAPLGIYPEHFLQLGAYSLAYKEEQQSLDEDEKILLRMGAIKTWREPTDLMIIRVGKDGKVNTLRASELGLSVPDCEQAWLSVLEAYRFLTPLSKQLKEERYARDSAQQTLG